MWIPILTTYIITWPLAAIAYEYQGYSSYSASSEQTAVYIVYSELVLLTIVSFFYHKDRAVQYAAEYLKKEI